MAEETTWEFVSPLAVVLTGNGKLVSGVCSSSKGIARDTEVPGTLAVGLTPAPSLWIDWADC